MTGRMNGMGRLHPNGRTEPNECRCPVCSSIISPAMLASIIGAENARRLEIEQSVEAKFAKQLADAEKARKGEIAAAVKAAVKVTETKLKTIREGQTATIAAAVAAEREKTGKLVAEAVATAKVEHATEKARLEADLRLLQTKLAARPAHAIGLPAEIDLHQQISTMLTAAGLEDRAERVRPGVAGADVVVEIVHMGKVCGTLIVESKNHKTWKSSFTTRLRENQLRAGAAFSILSSPIFWSGAPPHIALRDSVICAKPEAVPTLILMLRQIVVDNHLRALGTEARDEKAEQALDFLTGATCNDLFDRLLRLGHDLTALDQREQSAHSTTWARRAEITAGVIAVQQQFVRTVADIIAGGGQ